MLFLCNYVFFKHIIEVYLKLISLEIKPNDSEHQPENHQRDFWFHNLSTTVASDVTFNEQTWQKN